MSQKKTKELLSILGEELECKLTKFFNDIKSSNQEFIEQHDADYFRTFEDQQEPLATVILCSDSRVQEDAFEQFSINKLFVIRNIGNQLITALGSVDYGVIILKTPILMIVGHSRCGAVRAAHDRFPPAGLTDEIRHEVSCLDINQDESYEQSIIDNVHHQVAEACTRYAAQIECGTLLIYGAIYDFTNDYHHGHGKFFIINMNGQKDENLLSLQDNPARKLL